MKLVIDGVSKLYKGNVWSLRDFSRWGCRLCTWGSPPG
jgi:hypothetical protein